VASLLEVGTGFHPDLTGRENIYLNGVLMGMKKKEIDGKFDEIVDFAEIEKFLDTPVKRYSTGMYLRLAFSVAAHLEAEILLVDEVLAVGDATFQEKCLGKIGDVAKGGRTVLFVSHNMASIVKLCNYALWIDNGRIRSNGLPEKAVQTYLTSNLFTSDGRVEFSEPENTKEVFIRSVDLRDQYGEVTPSFNIFSPIYVHVTFCCKRKFLNWRVFVSVTRYDGVVVFSTTTWDYNSIRYPVGPGVYHARLLIPGRFLGPASYLLTVAFNEPGKGRLDVLENILRFDIFGTAFDYGRNIGLLVYPFEWKVDGDQ
jgi:lipopolysaccharide transport system ATP-binding protein